MKKKILAIALTFAMAAGMCACGTDKTPASAENSSDTTGGPEKRSHCISPQRLP